MADSESGQPQAVVRDLWKTLLETLRTDRFAQLMALVLVLASVTKLLSPLLAFPYVQLFGVLTILAILKDVDSLVRPHERRFWRIVASAQAVQLLESLLNIFSRQDPTPRIVLLSSIANAAVYVIWAGAAEGEPHRPRQRSLTGLERLLMWPTLTLFVFGLSLYFLIPDVFEKDGILQKFALYALLDFYLAARLLGLARQAESPRWQQLYTALSGAWTVQFLVSAGVILPGVARAPWTPAVASVLYFVVLTAIAIAARLRHQPLPGPVETVSVPHHVHSQTFLRSAQTLAFGLAFPILHYVIYRAGAFDERFRPLHEAIVLAVLAIFGTVAFIQHRLLAERSLRLWNERQVFEKTLRDSEEDLRLMIAKGRAAEAERHAQEKFDHAFRACPYAVVISRFDEGTIVEVNPAFERILGYRRDEVLGRTPDDLDLWGSIEDQEHFQEELALTMALREYRTLLRHKSGEPCKVLFSAEVLEIDGERSLLAIFRELDLQARTAELLGERAALVEDAVAAVVVLNSEGRIHYVNSAVTTVLGWAPLALTGRAAAEIFGDADSGWAEAAEDLDQRSVWMGPLRPLGAEGEPREIFGWGYRLDDGQLWFLDAVERDTVLPRETVLPGETVL